MNAVFSTLAAATAAVAITAGSAFGGELPTEGTINNFNLRLTCQTAGPEQTNTNIRTQRVTTRLETTRLTNTTILEALQAAGSISQTRGWRLVQIFDVDGVHIGIFASRRNYPPVYVDDSILDWVDPTVLVTTYSRTTNLEQFELVQDDTRTQGTLNIQVNGKDAAGTINCITRLRTLRSNEGTRSWRTVSCNADLSGVTNLESGEVVVFGKVSSSGGNRLTNIQDFIDAMAALAL